MTPFRIPVAPRSIQKDNPIKFLLDTEAVDCLAHNIGLVHSAFDGHSFKSLALTNIAALGIMDRSAHIAAALKATLPAKFSEATDILLSTLTPPNVHTERLGLSVFFYLPHTRFIADYGRDPQHNAGEDPFDTAMRAQYELTRRFTAEFSIRPFLMHDFERTLNQLTLWLNDADPHVRRLCSEGCRPRLPWGARIPQLIKDPRPTLPILEALKNDPSLYVRRSVANHLGDIAKDHPALAFEVCERWLTNADKDLKWVIRHAVRHPAKQGNAQARAIRLAAGGK
ncbi:MULTISPECIES: DNA alkylation repair protein [unclassified Methylophilus]|uniref:DNA alkylation repair protein n=1 Tax=Methylophilus glucosoxydans TaxID=752553 RepID=A0ABW3GGG9_9PROT|nr:MULTISPECIES: DNA alkylation repair protein [unclassified Methylophilus]MDF0379088.1 DNA alkylation repair protein [Methylophilus sp. YYY-1]MDT7848651.1 DNA alkylation repair protein [Methylophilus sp. VKM B-3414]